MSVPGPGRAEDGGPRLGASLGDDRVEDRPALVEAHISVPDPDAAQQIADDLVVRQLAACVQVLGPMTSVYAWRGEVRRSQEWLLLAKTTEESFPALALAVRQLHSYEVPEVVAVPITQALGDYVAWVRKNSDGIDDDELMEPDAD